MNSQKILKYLKQVQEKYREIYGIRFIGLFGSYARDEATKQSDIDILYTIDEGKKLSIFNYFSITRDLERIFKKRVDLVRSDAIKPKLKKYIDRDIQYV